VDRREITCRHITLEEVMRPAISVRQDTRAGAALEVMLDNGVPGIPMVNDRGYLVGFVNDAHLLASTLPKFVTLVSIYLIPLRAQTVGYAITALRWTGR
jgi:CBS-domain-containing membrane protein